MFVWIYRFFLFWFIRLGNQKSIYARTLQVIRRILFWWISTIRRENSLNVSYKKSRRFSQINYYILWGKETKYESSRRPLQLFLSQSTKKNNNNNVQIRSKGNVIFPKKNRKNDCHNRLQSWLLNDAFFSLFFFS